MTEREMIELAEELGLELPTSKWKIIEGLLLRALDRHDSPDVETPSPKRRHKRRAK